MIDPRYPKLGTRPEPQPSIVAVAEAVEVEEETKGPFRMTDEMAANMLADFGIDHPFTGTDVISVYDEVTSMEDGSITRVNFHKNYEESRLFDPGRVYITCGIMAEFEGLEHHIQTYYARHLEGDWGDLDDSDKAANDWAVKHPEDDRIHSSYETPQGKIFIVTYIGQSTTIMMAEEY